VDRWHDYLSGGNPTVSDAILDRLVSSSHRLELKGESMRKQRGRKAATT
jgi:DNA replication protein DnaC